MIEPSDQEFRYIGLDEAQIERLVGESNESRWLVYYEGLRLLMEEDSNHDSLPGDLHISRQPRWVAPDMPNGWSSTDLSDEWLFSSPLAVSEKGSGEPNG